MNVADAARRMGAERPAGAIAAHEIGGYSIDSRTAREGDLFFALRGERHDGHAFVALALERGAVAAVVEHVVDGVDAHRLVRVPDSLAALQGLAHNVLAEWGGPVVGITGSVGKTTTKDLTAKVLSAAGTTHKSVGNFNNAYGLPKSVLEMASDGRRPEDYDYAVLEMGMSTPGEIRRLTELAPPRVAVVTTVAPVHTEFFEDGIEGVARAKAEIVEGLAIGGTAVLNRDDPRVYAMHTVRVDAEVITFGFGPDADVTARNLEDSGFGGSRFELVTPSGTARVSLPLVGRHNVANALAAAGVAEALGIDTALVGRALSEAEPSKMRGQVVKLANGATILDDSYNSSPRALEAMVATLASIGGARRRYVIAGEMLELGPDSAEMHRESGRAIAAAGVDRLVGVRGDAREMVESAEEAGMAGRALFVETPREAADEVAGYLDEGDVVLVKGSRGVATDRAVARLVEIFGTAAETGGEH